MKPEPIAEEQRRNRFTVALLAILLLAGGGLLVRQLWFNPDNVTPVTRKPFDFVVDWRCLACSHSTRENAAVGPNTCPKCGKDEFYVSIPWSCPTHGQQPVAFQYDDDGQPTQVRIADGPWIQAIDPKTGWNIFCPACKQRMFPAGATK
jgi:hypothetical protein